MRILLFGNGWAAAEITAWLREEGEEFVGLVLHPPERRKHGKEILRSAGIAPARLLDGSQLKTPQTMERIKDLRPDIGISAFFGFILPGGLLSVLPKGCVNVHPALLPYNRGAYPNVWSIAEETPAGATIHWMDEGIDTGDIIAQREVEVEPVDTGATLYAKLEEACVALFKETWPQIRAGKAPRHPQPQDGGTFHRIRDVERIDHIDLDRVYTAREFLNLLRARTFPPYPGAYFLVKGRKVYVRVQLLYEEDIGHEREAGGPHTD